MSQTKLNDLLSNFIAGGVSAGQMYWIPVERVLLPLSYDELVQLANTLLFPVKTTDRDTLRNQLVEYLHSIMISSESSEAAIYKIYRDLSVEDLLEISRTRGLGLERYAKNRELLALMIAKTPQPSVDIGKYRWDQYGDDTAVYAALPQNLLYKLGREIGIMANLDTISLAYEIARYHNRRRRGDVYTYADPVLSNIQPSVVKSTPFYNPVKRAPPARKAKSPARKRKSPTRKAKSPTRKRKSPTRKAKSPTRKRKSPARKPARKAKSPARKAKSPARKRKSPKKSRSPRR
jgi:hypothetical protein